MKRINLCLFKTRGLIILMVVNDRTVVRQLNIPIYYESIMRLEPRTDPSLKQIATAGLLFNELFSMNDDHNLLHFCVNSGSASLTIICLSY